jgi:LuxR family maltose regulon positive regulatory protein
MQVQGAPQRVDTERTVGDDVLSALRWGVPAAPSVHVPRARLDSALAQAHRLPLVVVSAPAGTGKTTALADWVRERGGDATCWVELDDDPLVFWGPVLAALRGHGVAVPTGWAVPPGGTLGRQRLSQLTDLVTALPERLTVVVDGCELASVDVAREVDQLLRRSLGRLRFVLAGRVDPVMLLYRYRLTDAVLELRAPDLMLSDDEAARLLGESGVELGATAVRDLNRRLGGWAAGLRFAARALAGRDDPEAYVATVVEQTADINEYLVGEVLDVQPPEVRRFLLDTCVTDVLCEQLVERIGGAGAARTMTDLVARRAFVEPVPGHPDCFHYFPFLKNLLLARLSYESPERLAQLRRLAAGWYRSQGRHALSLAELATVGDWEEVATQVVADGLVGDLVLEDAGGALGAVLARMPVDIDLPAARVVRAVMALKHGEAGVARCTQELTLARRAVHDQDVDPALVVSLTVIEALRSCLGEDSARGAEVVAEAERLLAGSPIAAHRQEASALEVVATFTRGVTDLRLGDLAGAQVALAHAAMMLPDGLTTDFRADCLGHLALADALRGELATAVRHAEEALAVVARTGAEGRDARPSAHVALAWVAVERCDARLVEEHIAAARSSRLLAGDAFCLGLVEGAVAALERARGQAGPAIDRLEAAAQASAAHDPWGADQLRVEAARLRVCHGEPELALAVLGSVQLPDRPETLVAAAAARAELGIAGRGDGWPARDATAPLVTQVRGLLAEAAHADQQGSPGQAKAALSRALRLAATERMRRPFRESGASVRRLLAHDARLVSGHAWLQQAAPASAASRPSENGTGQALVVEPLTVKELEVLGHLAAHLTTDEIAEKLFVSVNTVRTHIRNILRKLGVSRRHAAVRRARELGMLED